MFNFLASNKNKTVKDFLFFTFFGPGGGAGAVPRGRGGDDRVRAAGPASSRRRLLLRRGR